MNCRRARKVIFEFVDGLTDESVQVELERHLAECTECEALATSLRSSLDLVHAAPEEPLDENFNWKVRLAVHRERDALQDRLASQGALLRAWNLRYVASAATGFAAIFVAGWLVFGGGDAPLPGSPDVSRDVTSLTESASQGGGSSDAQQPEFRIPRRGAMGPEQVVAEGARAASGEQGRSGAIDVINSPARFDSLLQQHTIHMNEELRERLLQSYMDVLQRLEACKEKCP